MTIRSMILGGVRLPLTLAVAALVAACGTEKAPGPLEPSCTEQGRARFVNLITDPARNPVNVILEDVPWGVNLGYTATTPASLPAPSTALYSAVCAGERTVVIQRTADPSATVATLGFDVDPNGDHTVYAIGGTGGNPVALSVTTDDNTVAPTASQTRIRVVNMSPTAGAIDVFLTVADADLAAATPIATNLAYQAASAYLNVTPGTFQLRAVPAGTAPANRAANVVVTQSGLVLPGGGARTIVTADNTTGGTPRRAFLLTDR